MSSNCIWRYPSPCSISTSRPSWQGWLGGRSRRRRLGAPTYSSTVARGVQHISKPVLGTSPTHQAENITQASGESLPEIDGTCHVQRAISNYTALLNTSSKMQGL